MADSLCNLLLGYWVGLHGGPKGKAPHVEDALFRTISPNIFILTCESGGRATFSATGSGVRSLFAEPAEDVDFFDLWTQADRQLLRSMIAAMIARRVPLSVVAEIESGGATNACLEFALMPVTVTDFSYVLGIVVCVSKNVGTTVFSESLHVVKATPLDGQSDRGATVNTLRKKHVARDLVDSI
jgi:hypothetical protein